LLRVLQEREFERVGDTQTIRVDVRVIAASNRDLQELVDKDEFREDLYYRLNVVPLHLPPLRQRRDDIPELVGHFLTYYNEENDRYVAHIEPRAMASLQEYDWPGNVRELQNYVERAVVMAEGDELTVELVPDAVLHPQPRRMSRDGQIDFPTLVRDVVQVGLASLIAISGIRITSFEGLFGISELPISAQYTFTILAIVGITNAFNLIDGIDGLAGSEAVFVGVTSGISGTTH
jgi:transcriptional regulator of acetoin/glycerol metabolism